MLLLDARGYFVQLSFTIVAVLALVSVGPAAASAQAQAPAPSAPTATAPPVTTEGVAEAPAVNAPPGTGGEAAQAPTAPVTAPTEVPMQAGAPSAVPGAEGEAAAPQSAGPPVAGLTAQQPEDGQVPAPQSGALPSPSLPPAGTPVASDAPTGLDQYVHLQTIVRLNERRELLLAANRKWKVPAIVMGIGVSTLVIGGLVFHRAWNQPEDCYNGWCESDFNERMDVTGLVMMPVGAAIVLASAVPLIVRVARTKRLRRVEARLEQLRFAPVTQ